MACHDLWGKVRAAPLWKLWGLTPDNPAADQLHDRHRHDRDHGRKASRVRRLADLQSQARHAARYGNCPIAPQTTDAVFRVDANCGWTADEAIANSAPLRELGVQFIEQPLPANDWEAMAKVFRHAALPVIADESCRPGLT